MKRLLLFASLASLCVTSIAFGQATRRVLVEEFTNTGCPPCAATDPMVESFEFSKLDQITAIKWHVSWPDNTDPFYNAQSPTTLSDTRGTKYYGVTGVPFVSMNGSPINGKGNFSTVDQQSFMDFVTSEVAKSTPYEIDVTQDMTADSIIANITIKCLGAPVGTNLLLGTVFAERYNPFHGNNGRPFYTSIVRAVPSGLAASGAIATTAKYPAFTIANGETKTFRIAAKLGSTWTKNEMMSVAFIQDADTKEVYNSNWTVPAIKVEAPAQNVLTVPSGSNSLSYSLTNLSSGALNLKAVYSASGVPANWNVAVSGVGADSSLTVAASGNAAVTVASTAATNMTGYKPFTVTFMRNDGFYIGAADGKLWGANNKNIIVDANAGTTSTGAKCAQAMTAIGTSLGDYATTSVVVPRADFEAMFDDWSNFHTVIYNAGVGYVGLYSDVGTWEKIQPYLAQGGHFMISSNVAASAYGQSGNQTLIDLWTTVFHIDAANCTYDNTTPWSSLVGVSGDPLGGGINTTVSGQTASTGLMSIDETGVACFQDENGLNTGIRAEDPATHGKTLVTTFDIETVKAADRGNVAAKIMAWFDGAASVKTSDNATAFTMSNYPNPAKINTNIRYSLTTPTSVTLTVSDVMGREVARLMSGEQQNAGTYEADFNVSKLATGTYIVTLNAGGKILTSTVNVVK